LDKDLTIQEIDLLDQFMNSHLVNDSEKATFTNEKIESFLEDLIGCYLDEKRKKGKGSLDLKELLYGSLPQKDIRKIQKRKGK